jgi:hypothetical protein
MKGEEWDVYIGGKQKCFQKGNLLSFKQIIYTQKHLILDIYPTELLFSWQRKQKFPFERKMKVPPQVRKYLDITKAAEVGMTYANFSHAFIKTIITVIPGDWSGRIHQSTRLLDVPINIFWQILYIYINGYTMI